MILLVTRSLIRWLSNSLLKFSIHTHSTIYFGKTLVELSGTMKWNEMKKLNILTLFSHLLLSQQIVKCTLLSAILPFSTKAVVKYQLMIAGKLMKKTYWERENIQNIMKKRCAFVTVFNILFFHSHSPIIPWYHAQYVQQVWLINFTWIIVNIIVSISDKSIRCILAS